MEDEESEEVRQARQARFKYLVGRLDAISPIEPQDIQREGELEQTLLLNTTVASLSRWLKAKTRTAHHFPTEEGYYDLQQAHKPRRFITADQDDSLLTLNALFHEKEGGILLHYQIIRFLIIPLAGGDIAVQARCSNPAVVGYYRELVSEMDNLWHKG